MEYPKTVTSSRTSFIRVFEVWTPDSSRQSLTIYSASYGGLSSFEKLSLKTSFSCGEGLPGLAWQEKRPVVFKEFDSATFLRKEAAHEVGLTSGVAIPLFADDELKAVLVMLCGDIETASGAIEVWQDDGLSGMSLVDGYYGDLERFEWLSKVIKFPKGVGLPGGVWKTQSPYIIGDLATSTSFLRAANAKVAGISTGIGIPFYSPENSQDVSAVLTFLSANRTPIAQRFEVWDSDVASDQLYFATGIDQTKDKVEPMDQHRRIAAGQGVIGQVYNAKIPIIADAPKSSEYKSMLAIPIQRPNKSVMVVVFYQ